MSRNILIILQKKNNFTRWKNLCTELLMSVQVPACTTAINLFHNTATVWGSDSNDSNKNLLLVIIRGVNDVHAVQERKMYIFPDTEKFLNTESSYD